MKTSPTDFYKSTTETILQIQWSHWRSLGVFAESKPHTSTLIDPEALICSTMFFGRRSARIFDESMDWIALNSKLISLDRLKTIAAMHCPETRAALGAVLDYMWNNEGLTKFKNKSERWIGDARGEKEPFFKSETYSGKERVERYDNVFYDWGFQRMPVKLRRRSRAPDLSNPANLRLKLKKIFGIGAKSEVVAYLLLRGEGNSNEIADAVSQNQRAVYSALNELVDADIVSRIDSGRKSIYSTRIDRWRDFLGMDDYPRYMQWAYIFSGLEQLFADYEKNPDLYKTAYLSSSRFRDITPALSRRLYVGGVKTPPPKITEYPGEEYYEPFLAFLNDVMNEIAA